MLFQPSNQSTQDSINNKNHNKKTSSIILDNLIIVNNSNTNRISKQTFNFINQYEGNKKINIQTCLDQSNPFTAFLKCFSNNKENINLIAQSNRLFKSAEFYLMLKTGQYFISKSFLIDEKQYLLFTEHHVTYLQTKNNALFGYKYKHNKYLYIGYFMINNQSLDYQHQGTGIFTQYVQQNKCRYAFINGRFKDGQIYYGVKQIFNQSAHIKQSNKFKLKDKVSEYNGSFRNMKYNGYGVLKTYNMQEINVQQGIFEFGKFLTKQEKQKDNYQFARYDDIMN